MCYEISLGEIFLIQNSAFLLLFISLCVFHRAFYQMFSHTLKKLDHRNENQDDEKFLCDLIRFHNTVKE